MRPGKQIWTPSSGPKYYRSRQTFQSRFPVQNRHRVCNFHQRSRVLVVHADKNFYQLLDIPQDADTRTIKKAFKKMALKYHPDVNKEADAKDRFMACKTAYQTLADEKERKKYDQTLSGGGGGFDWGSFGQGFGQSSSSQKGKKAKKEEEEFYGFTQFFDDLGRSASSGFAQITNLFRDLEKEYQDRQAKKTGQPRSLWQELYDIGEEFVDFLEQGVGSTEKGKANASSQEKNAKEAGEKASQNARKEGNKAEENVNQRADEAKQNADDEIEAMLAELKRKSSKNE